MPPQHRSALARLAAERGRYEQLVVTRFGGTLSREDAEDIVSDALLAVAGKVPPGAGRAWFARVVLNRAEDFRRARDGRRSPRAFVELDEQLAATPEDDGFDRALAHRTVHRALRRLPAEYGTLIRRRHLHGASRREIATALNLSLHQYEKRHALAWGALLHLVASDEPTARCRPVRRSRTYAEAHLVECLNCRLALRFA
ncbi:sigma-70 family RNA polymerase sigma factor [Solirubrobacter sp. CPCC 204708]|uniref:Sigma-70 family RNA polymerase sigma factor n=1 Tax=Solirubrobacter deserti TaxID=2282478 RepID=A0ABT4RDX6_9ACTN|nr:sigma-70 family RNA polymerase sigma factor [Solirubrobacter deserti]MBE2315983.1 sigma-70 family RNA polymerase sigma factor [Solirubrobacter deserti]MDA0136734.1 sigma-70 family RNA polymerase sigma factor [Solirubrobacter deserti]